MCIICLCNTSLFFFYQEQPKHVLASLWHQTAKYACDQTEGLKAYRNAIQLLQVNITCVLLKSSFESLTTCVSYAQHNSKRNTVPICLSCGINLSAMHGKDPQYKA